MLPWNLRARFLFIPKENIEIQKAMFRFLALELELLIACKLLEMNQN
jgi:hypothetical protein